jgi:polyhydroxybutyrate depolymerase
VTRRLALALAFLVVIGVAVFASVQIMSAVERPSTTTSTHSIKVGSLTRQYEVIAASSLPESAPILVVLSGAAATTSDEITRDRLMPYATAGKVELVYPMAIEESWNAIGCCDGAAKLNIDDVGFMKALVPAIDPGRARPIYIVGYSVGGRLAYRLACTDPTLVDGMVAVKADPMPGCVVTQPMNVMVFSSMDDKYVPYKPGEKGLETPAATVQIARLQTDLKCAAKTVARHGTMTLSTWSCADGKTLEWALYQSGGHDFPAPDGDTPGANQLIWSFVAKTALAPVPR